MEDNKKTAAEETEKTPSRAIGTALDRPDGKDVGPEELADELEEATEKAGGRESLIKRFGTADLRLSKPVEWRGKTYTDLHLDFEGLTGLDMEAIDDEIGNIGLRGMVPAYSRMYQRMLAARAAKVPADMIEHLPLVDYNAIISAAQNFLFVTG